jgi:iron complex transport system permease protein
VIRQKKISSRNLPLNLVLGLMVIFAALAEVLTGGVLFTLKDLADLFRGGGDETRRLILLEIRLPRGIMAFGVGAALGVSGAAFQGIFRNSLADPYVIGASSGAALGAALAITLGFTLSGPVSGVTFCAFGGSLGAVFLAFGVSRSVGNPAPAPALLLAGVSLSSLFSALLSLILVLHDRALHQVYYWLLGSLSGVTWAGVTALLPVMGIGGLTIFFLQGPLDLLLQGEDTAESLGISVGKIRLLIAGGGALAAAGAVSAGGIIGFVGLIAPHGARLLIGPAHRRLLPASALLGGLLVILADLLARNVADNFELPIGIITSLGGAPFFIYLLARHGRRVGGI